MADAAREFIEAMKRKDAAEAAGATNALLSTNAVAPAMQRSQFEIARQERGEQQLPFSIRNQKDVPIDMSQSPGAWVKFQVASRRDPIDKMQYLEQQYGKGMVRFADDGTPLIRVPTNRGVREIPIDEEGLSWSDLATMGGYAPEILGSVIGPILARKVGSGPPSGGLLGFTRDVVTSAVGAETAGLAKDVAVSQAPASQLALERLGMVGSDIAAGAVLGGAGVLAGKAISPFAKGATEQTQRMRQALQGPKGLNELAEAEFQATAGQITGNQFLQRAEARMEKIPGASGPYADIKQAQRDFWTRLQNRQLGLPANATPEERMALPSAEQVGSESIDKLASVIDAQQGRILASQAQAQAGLSKAVMDELAQATSVERQIAPEVGGNAVRSKIVADKEVFDTKMDEVYGELDKMLGGKSRIFRLPKLAQAAQEELKSLPQTGGQAESAQILGPNGEVVANVTRPGATEVSSQFVPPNVTGKLQEMARAGDEYKSISDLRKMRTEARNDIKASEAIPGTQTHYLSRIIGMLDDAIEEAASVNPELGMKEALDNAAKQYREGITPFKNKYVSQLFKDVEQAGYVPDYKIVTEIDPEKFKAFKAALGENSPEFNILKRGIADQIMVRSTDNGLVDGNTFIKELKAFKIKNETPFKEIFGASESNLKKLANMLEESGQETGFGRVGPSKLNADRLRALLDEPGALSKPDIVQKIGALADEQSKLDKLYRSKVVKAIGEGRLGDLFDDSAQFVNRFMKTASPKEAAQVMGLLSDDPTKLENLKRKMIESIWHDAQAAAAPQEIATVGRGEAARMSSARKLHEYFGDEQRKEVLQTVLGEDTYRQFVKMADVLTATQSTEQAFASSGGIAGGMFVGGMIRDPLRYGPDWIKERVAAIMLTTPGIRSWMRGTTMTPERIGTLTRTMLASREFIEAASQEFGDNQLPFVLSSLKRSVDIWEKRNAAGTQEEPQSAMQFIEQMKRRQTNAPAPPRVLRTQ